MGQALVLKVLCSMLERTEVFFITCVLCIYNDLQESSRSETWHGRMFWLKHRPGCLGAFIFTTVIIVITTIIINLVSFFLIHS